MAPRLLALSATAEYLSLTPDQVRALKYRRQIPFVKVGRSLRFDVRDLDRWIEQNKTEAIA